VLVDITFGGCTVPWSFFGAKAFGNWLDSRPWLKEGGSCVLRTGQQVFDDVLIPAIAKSVRGAHGDAGKLDLRRIDCGGDLGNPFQALLGVLEIDAGIGPFEAREPLANRLRHHSSVFIFSESRGAVDPQVWVQFMTLMEHYRKADPQLKICTVVLDSRGVVPGEPIFDYSSGRATHHVLDEAAESEDSTLWPPYVHQRVCWEAGGSFEYADALNSELTGVLSGDDGELERVLNRVSTEKARQDVDMELVKNYLGKTPVTSVLPLQSSSIIQTKLLEQRALWRPPGMRSLKVAPWLSRFLLAEKAVEGPTIWSLRHNLVCAPLAAEILALCLTIESGIRTQLHGRTDRSKLKIATIQSHEKFRQGNDLHIEYPTAHPSPPKSEADVWAFASFGEMLLSCPVGAVSDSYWRTLRLRNGIAHGHYVGWPQVRLAAQQLRRFDARA